jgi:sulfoacetaldehyde acetyltransferase
MTPSEALLEQSDAEDTEVIFGLVGLAFMDVLDLLPAVGIRCFPVRHEQNAAHMAGGYAQALCGRKPGVCIAQNGPGVTNTVTGIKAARLNHSPVVLLSPTATSGSIGTDGFQETDTMAILADCVGWQGRLENRSRIAEYVRTAHREALAGKAPARIDFPRDPALRRDRRRRTQPRAVPRVERRVRRPRRRRARTRATGRRRATVIIAGLGVIQSGTIEAVAAVAETELKLSA